MRFRRLFGDVWLWWGKGWAVQFWPGPHFSLGFHVDLNRALSRDMPERRPLIDLHLGWFIVALGPDSHITGQQVRHSHSCRGFMFLDDPHL